MLPSPRPGTRGAVEARRGLSEALVPVGLKTLKGCGQEQPGFLPFPSSPPLNTCQSPECASASRRTGTEAEAPSSSQDLLFV